jgi:hypothetical protein
MNDRTARDAIEDNPRGGRRNKSGNPIAELCRESATVWEVQDVFPTDGVQSFPNVKPEEKRWRLGFVQAFGEVFDIEKIIMNVLFFNEDTLRDRP